MKTQDIRNMALALQAVEEASKKKMDPVGREDDDIDNDGDKDKSDSYLHNRRKAISSAIKGKGTKETVTTEALVGNQHKIDANKNGKIDAHDFKLLRKGKKVAEEAEEVEEGIVSYFKDIYKKVKDEEDAKAVANKQAGRALRNIEKKSGAKVHYDAIRLARGEKIKEEAEQTEWPVFARIQEKINQTKGATKPESMEDRLTASDKKVVDGHGGLGIKTPEDFVDDNEIDRNEPLFKATNVKVAPKRHNDQTVGDKTMPKAK